LRGLYFTFKSTSGEAISSGSNNLALGTIIMATNYDAAATNFQSKAEMENAEFTVSCKPSRNARHMIECSKKMSVLGDALYILSSSAIANALNGITGVNDLRFSNFGNFQLATSGFQGTTVTVGELWVTYQVDLLKPRLYDALGYDVMYWYVVTNGTGVTTNIPFGTTNLANNVATSSTIFDTSNTLDLNTYTQGTASTNSIFQFAQSFAVNKDFLIYYTVYGSGSSTGADPVPPLIADTTSVVQLNRLYYKGNSTLQSFNNCPFTDSTNVSYNLICVYTVRYLANTGLMTLNFNFGTAATYPGTIAQMSLMITELPLNQGFATA